MEITENRGKVKNLLCLVARDKDRGKNAEVNYVIVSGNKTLFHINDTSGTLSSESLNFEDTMKHVLRIRATDHGDLPRSSFTTVEVLVKNVNDAPTFESEEIAGRVSESSPFRVESRLILFIPHSSMVQCYYRRKPKPKLTLLKQRSNNDNLLLI